MWWALRSGREPGDALDRAYALLCRRMQRAGVERAAHEGPVAYLQRLRAALPQATTLLEPLFADYIRLRYACAEPDLEDSRQFARAVRQLRVRANSR
jgi:hypothetical protein